MVILTVCVFHTLYQITELFSDSKRQLDQCTVDLQEASQQLQEMQRDLQQAREELSQEQFVSSELASTEEALHTTANQVTPTSGKLKHANSYLCP